jgi:AraC-like DNA-binding protein
VGTCRTIDAFASRDVGEPVLLRQDLVESIADLDIPDADTARRLSMTLLPGVSPYIVLQYRTSTESFREYGGTGRTLPPYRHIAAKLHTGLVTVRAPGPVGVIAARLKPDAAARLLGDQMAAFMDAKIALGDVINPNAVDRLQDRVSEAGSSAARLAIMMQFLHAHARDEAPDALVARVAKRLRYNPLTRIRQLADEAGMSERHLSRRFRLAFGTSPKHFARMARFERLLASRASERSWAGLACASGFADQAHMINDFRDIVGAPPEQVLTAVRARMREPSRPPPILMW